MGIESFLSSLFQDGRVRVANEDPSDDELARVDDLLADFERQYRDDLPGTPPPVYRPAARFGAATLYCVCRFLALRDIDAAAIERALRAEPDLPRSPVSDYSVDLTLRFLPDVYRLAVAAAPGDPLAAEIVRLARRWPLSSVGIPAAEDAEAGTLFDDPCLGRLYVDRIIARRDSGRLNDPRVRAMVTASLGMYPDLAPDIARVCGMAAAGEGKAKEPS